jgi:hypothetical protein
LPRVLDLISLGSDAAAFRGVDVKRAERLALIGASLSTGAAVSLGGPIPFVGIIVPHMVRLMVGADHRIVLPASALFGATFLIVCDLVARTVFGPVEPPVGTVTALLGGPFFLMVTLQTDALRKTRVRKEAQRRFFFATFATFAFVVTALVGVTRGPGTADHLDHPRDNRDAVCDGRGRSGGRDWQLRQVPPKSKSSLASVRCSIRMSSGSSACGQTWSCSMAQQQDLRTQLDRARIPYFPYVHKGLPDISETIRALGARIGAGDRANSLAARLEQQIREVRARVASRPKVTTLVVFGRERGTLRGIDASGGYGFLHDMLEAAGGTNVLAEIKTQAVQMSRRWSWRGARGNPRTALRSQATRRRPQAVGHPSALFRAVGNKRVYLLQGPKNSSVPGPRVGAATERLAKNVTPKRGAKYLVISSSGHTSHGSRISCFGASMDFDTQISTMKTGGAIFVGRCDERPIFHHSSLLCATSPIRLDYQILPFRDGSPESDSSASSNTTPSFAGRIQRRTGHNVAR